MLHVELAWVPPQRGGAQASLQGVVAAVMEDEAHRPDEPALIDDRYRVGDLLGRGGMAEVYRVYDMSTGRTLALKRLSASGPSSFGKHILQLFEQEFQTLSQLQHPRVIEAYDYARDAVGPYYTMELLDGGDLRELSALPYQRAAKLLCDVCSALSLLHSRRLVHRDLTPRNIRCTHDGNAKLFDFGSMARMGVAKHIVGTPPFMAPEALSGQALDARTDLFALGATAYFALTGRHAFPARRLSNLDAVWRAGFVPLSRFVDVPPALEDLVNALLQLEPAHRPANAAEVMERLSAIGGFSLDESLLVPNAYLSTPTLVGRDDAQRRARRHLHRAHRAKGGALLVLGTPGVGRSRFVDACAMDAKLSGALVLRVRGHETRAKWDAARALLQQLAETVPELAQRSLLPHVAVLEELAPEIVALLRAHQTNPQRPAEPLPHRPLERRAAIQTALRAALITISQRRTLVLAVDDVAQVDEPSAALLALLADQGKEHPVWVVASASEEPDAGENRPVALLRSLADAIRLRPLTGAETQRLLLSLFGDVPNARWLAERLHAASGGIPSALMQMSQALVDRGLVRYQAGGFILPSALDLGALPNSYTEQLTCQVAALPQSARELAQAAALCDLHALSLQDCRSLAAQDDAASVLRDLSALEAATLFVRDDDRYAFAGPEVVTVLERSIQPDCGARLHRRASRLFAARDNGAFRSAMHWLNAGDRERAIEVLVGHLVATRGDRLQEPGALAEHIQALPKRWPETLRALITACDDLGRPARERFTLQSTLVAYSALTGRHEPAHLCAIADQLSHDAGLDLYDALASEPAQTRLQTALAQAVERYQEGNNPQCVLSPVAAISQLAQVNILAIGMATRALDHDLLARMPSLAPLTPLSPALAIVQQDVETARHSIAGRYDRSHAGYLGVLRRLDEPDHAGLQASYYTHLRLALIMGIAQQEATHGIPLSGPWTTELERHPVFAVCAQRIRVFTALAVGDIAKAEEHRAAAERLQIQNSPNQLFEGLHLLSMIAAHGEADNLLRVKQYAAEIETLARELPNWLPCLHFARGIYQQLRGDHARACEELERALRLSKVGHHPTWPGAAGRLLTSLVALGRHDEVVALGNAQLEILRQHALDYHEHVLLAPMALAEAARGNHERARLHAEAAMWQLEMRGTRGVRLASAYETRARVALAARDGVAFDAYAQLCDEQLRAARNPTLRARYKRMLREAAEFGLSPSMTTEVSTLNGITDSQLPPSSLMTLLNGCRGPQERAGRALALILEASCSDNGYLYVIKAEGPVLIAHEGHASPPTELERLVGEHLAQASDTRADLEATVVRASHATKEARADSAAWADYAPMLLCHPNGHHTNITGVAVVFASSRRPRVVSPRLLHALSRALVETGDALTYTECAAVK